MVSCVACFLTLALVSAFSIVSMDARSWDIAVTIGPNIEFFAKNRTKTGSANITGAVSLAGLAYDNETKTMYITDSENANLLTYRENNKNKTESKPYVLKKSEPHSYVPDVVYDPVTKTLFWIKSNPEALMKLKVDENTSQPEELIDLTGLTPQGLALDVCNRWIYWTNRNLKNATIERSRLDGSERKIIVTEGLIRPYGIVVDHNDEKLYWIDDEEGIHFSIGKSNLDGTGYEKFLHDTYDQAFYIAVDKEAVYWSDRTSKTIQKKNKTKRKEYGGETFVSYESSDLSGRVSGIITRDNIDDIDCKAISERLKNRSNIDAASSAPIPHPSSIESNDDTATDDVKVSNSISQADIKCLNKGIYDNSTATCRCESRFTGPLCERNICDGYCLNDGICSVSGDITKNTSTASCHCKEGFTGLNCERNICEGYCLNYGLCSVTTNVFGESIASCRCENGYAGNQCERYVCEGYCLNGGNCSVSPNGEPFCKCENYRGSRCEYSIEFNKLCSLYCMGTEEMLNSLNITFCRCNETIDSIPSHLLTDTELDTQSTIILSVLITTIGILVTTVGVLSYHVHKLRRRPRIRKRFVVNKSGGVTPLTSRPQLPSDSCEITIENCCNMNICETPCFEPKLRSPPSKSNGTKKEEKNSLLDSMEGADSC